MADEDPTAVAALVAECAQFRETLRSERAWRNIQPILLASFASVAQLLTSQAAQLQKVHEQLTRVHTSMDEMCARMEAVEAKEPSWRQQLIDRMDAKIELSAQTTVARVMTETETQADAKCGLAVAKFGDSCAQELQHQFASWKHDRDSEWSAFKLQMEVQTQRQLDAALDMRKQELLRAHDNLMEEAVDKLERTFEENNKRRMSQRVNETSSLIQEQLAKTTRECQEMQAKMVSWRQELLLTLSNNKNSYTKNELGALLHRKLDAKDAREQFAAKADTARLDEAVDLLKVKIEQAQDTMKRELQQLRNCNSSKADALEMTHITQRIHELVAVVESLQQESSGLRSAITQKLDVDDAAQLVESRTTLVGLNSAMQHVERAMAEDFVTKSELQGVTQQVQAIQQQLRSELFHARYIWKEGRPSATKQTISWDTQIVNTRTDIFVWKRGSDQILLKIPGLYHLQAAFFTDFAPTIHILVNGEPALVYSAGEDDSALLANSGSKYEKEKMQNGRRPGPSVRRVHHSAGNIVGVAMDALLALPARAVVQIAYDIDENAQGFLSLRKL